VFWQSGHRAVLFCLGLVRCVGRLRGRPSKAEPCHCDYYNHPEKECVGGPGVVKRYVYKISGPLLDRIDLHVEVTPVSYDELTNAEQSKLNSAEIRDRMLQARAAQWAG